jgi:putative spermidine/putrescine transport system permease protein
MTALTANRVGRRSGRAARLPRTLWISLLLAPAMTVVIVLFLGGLGLGFAQSLGYLPFLPGWHGSLQAYRDLWHDSAVHSSLALTLRISVISTATASVLGVLSALLLHRVERARRALTVLFAAPLPVPHLVGALAMLLLLSQSGLLSRLSHAAGLTATPAAFPALTADSFGWAIIAEYVWKETPFVGVVVLAALAGGVEELTAAARTLGAGTWQRFRHVTLPLITPAVSATSILVFAFTFGSYEVPYLLGRPYPAVLPVVALQYQQDVDLRARPEAMALALLIAAVVTVLTLVYLMVIRRFSGRAR